MFGQQQQQRGASPLMGGVAGMLLNGFINRRLARRGGGGIKGMLLGMAATWAVNKFINGRQGNSSQRQWQRR
jgi:hypothetical protein